MLVSVATVRCRLIVCLPYLSLLSTESHRSSKNTISQAVHTRSRISKQYQCTRRISSAVAPKSITDRTLPYLEHKRRLRTEKPEECINNEAPLLHKGELSIPSARTNCNSSSVTMRISQDLDSESIEGDIASFRKGISEKDVVTSVKAYEKVHSRILLNRRYKQNFNYEANRSKVASSVKLGDLRVFCFMLRSNALKHIGTDRGNAFLKLIQMVIEDMRLLGFRVGTTELAMSLFSYNNLGVFAKSIDLWRRAMSESTTGKRPVESFFTGSVVRHINCQAHIYALNAATSLKNPHIVKEIYSVALASMESSCTTKLDPPKSPPIPTVSFFLSVLSERKVALDKTGAPPYRKDANPPSNSTHSWDAGRLGYDFIICMYRDAQKWVRTDKVILNSIIQVAARALFLEGKHNKAIQLFRSMLALASPIDREMMDKSRDSFKLGYTTNGSETQDKEINTTAKDLRNDLLNHDNVEALLSPGFISEVIRRISKGSRLNEAWAVMDEMGQKHRSISVWNSLFDGISSQESFRKRYHHDNIDGLDRLAQLRDAIQTMKDWDGIEPDAVTHSIWMRLCLRIGDWKPAVECFRKYDKELQTDIVSWDILIRGLIDMDDIEAQREGWSLLKKLGAHFDCKEPASNELGDTIHLFPKHVDERIVTTALISILNKRGLDVLDENEARDTRSILFNWVERSIHFQDKVTYAVIIKALLRNGQPKDAMDIYMSMKNQGVFPGKSINCMLVEAISSRMWQEDDIDPVKFIEGYLPPQHYALAYAIVLKIALKHKKYDYGWKIIDKYYPRLNIDFENSLEEGSTRHYYYPDRIMYHTFLQMSQSQNNHNQFKLMLARMRAHIDLMHNLGVVDSKIVDLYAHYRQHPH